MSARVDGSGRFEEIATQSAIDPFRVFAADPPPNRIYMLGYATIQ